eukprot:gene48322-55306_t
MAGRRADAADGSWRFAAAAAVTAPTSRRAAAATAPRKPHGQAPASQPHAQDPRAAGWWEPLMAASPEESEGQRRWVRRLLSCDHLMRHRGADIGWCTAVHTLLSRVPQEWAPAVLHAACADELAAAFVAAPPPADSAELVWRLDAACCAARALAKGCRRLDDLRGS